MLKRIAITCLALLLAGMTAPAQADLVIDIADTTAPSGGYSTLNIYLQSTTGSSDDAIDIYSLQLTITGPNELNFTAGGGAGYLGDANYIFSGDSGDATNLPDPIPPYNIPMGYPSPGPTIQIGDNSADFNPVIPSISPGITLLASLQIYAEATNPNEVYTVQVANASFINLMSTDPNYTPPNFTTSGGTITITGAVPEPASIVSGMTAFVLLAGFSQVCRLRRSARRSPMV